MSSEITLPLWAFVILSGLSMWSLLEKFFFPSLEWVVKRKLRLMVEKLNTKLALKIRPFKLTKRQVLIDRLMFDPTVLEEMEKIAKTEGISQGLLSKRVKQFAREIVPAFNVYFYFRIGYALSRWIGRWLYRVRLTYQNEESISKIPEKSAVIFVMNHRSNMDYVLVSYLVAEKMALSYAVGEWARIWPLQQMVRAMGAFFVRRASGDKLYRTVLERYINMATEARVTQAIFVEGKLTKNGLLQDPKLGLLDYISKSFNPSGEQDLYFIPIGLNYDRVLEDRTLIQKPDTLKKGPFFATLKTIQFLFHNFFLMIRQKWFRFGYAVVNFGPPVSLKKWMEKQKVNLSTLEKEERFKYVKNLADEITEKISRAVPTTPVSLVAEVFIQNQEKDLSLYEIKVQCHQLQAFIKKKGGTIYLPRGEEDYTISVGLRMLTLRHMVLEKNGLFKINPKERELLNYYSNSIKQFFNKD